eukprot:Clim_evm13s209 gene=Clim_evmTU13s209
MAPNIQATQSADSPAGPAVLPEGVVSETELCIDGVAYDVKDFVKRHPGGSVIKFYQGMDATQPFKEFHLRSPKAMKMLAALPHRELDPKAVRAKDAKAQALLDDYNALRAQLEAEGFYDPSIPHVVYRITELVLMHIAGIWMVYNGWMVTGLAVLGIVQGRCGWFMHEGGHHSLTGHIPTDIFIQEFFYGVGCGMSAAFWRNQHNKHHAAPQKLKHDVDLDTLPLIAFNKAIGKYGSRWWLRMQAHLFAPVITTLVALGWQFYLHPRHSLRIKNFKELGWMVVRYMAWYALFVPKYGGWNAAGMYLLYVMFGAAYIFVNFAVSHTHLPVVEKNDKSVNWIHFAAIHTMNAEDSWWCNWWMSYLNFQIEHHLFPCMPQFRHPESSKRVKALFEKHGLPYLRTSYWEAVKMTWANLYEVGNDH